MQVRQQRHYPTYTLFVGYLSCLRNERTTHLAHNAWAFFRRFVTPVRDGCVDAWSSGWDGGDHYEQLPSHPAAGDVDLLLAA